MRKTVLTLTVLLALTALIPATFAAEAPAAATTAPAVTALPTALHLPSPAASPSQPASDFALWLTKTGPIANPEGCCLACDQQGLVCCGIGRFCQCCAG